MPTVHVIILLIFGLFVQDDKTIAPSTLAITAFENKAFTSKDDCEAAWAKIMVETKKHPELVRAVGHSCDDLAVEPVGTDIL
jgi:hypothetical protein